MSTFYGILSNYYEQLYPVVPAQIEMITEFIGAPPKRILSIGAATGELAKMLYDCDYSVMCLDKEPKMLEKVREHESNIETVEMDMLDMDVLNGGFSAVLALGDVLAHINSKQQLTELLTGIASKLVPYGSLIIELNNYDAIMSSKEKKLPDIVLKGGTMGLKRTFEFDERYKSVKRSIIRVDDLLIETKQQIYPIKNIELQDALTSAGFTEISLYGNYNAEAYNPRRSNKLIVMARKNS